MGEFKIPYTHVRERVNVPLSKDILKDVLEAMGLTQVVNEEGKQQITVEILNARKELWFL